MTKKVIGLDWGKKVLIIILAGVTGGLSLNFFLSPANVFSAGMNGIAQIVNSLLISTLHIQFDTGYLILLFNIPVFILGFIKLGKTATILSFVNVLSISLFTVILPVREITDNVLMNAIAGGVLLGIGGGFSLKYGFTTGGMDIVSLVLSKTTGKTVGNFMFMLNGLIVLAAGFLFDWESALYTIISIYAMSTVVDQIHTSHQKVTAMIVTQNPDIVSLELRNRLIRGMTKLPALGGYNDAKKTMIMMVITRYEVYDLEQAIQAVDPSAFVNIVPTQSIIGHFANEEEQKAFKQNGWVINPNDK